MNYPVKPSLHAPPHSQEGEQPQLSVCRYTNFAVHANMRYSVGVAILNMQSTFSDSPTVW